jgi:hypothetical protein
MEGGQTDGNLVPGRYDSMSDHLSVPMTDLVTMDVLEQ